MRLLVCVLLLSSSIALQSSFRTPAVKAAPKVVEAPPNDSSQMFGLGVIAFSLLPLAGSTSRRATVETTVVPRSVWTHDQLQGVVNVNVPVRGTVIKLRAGGLWVHNPGAPTGEYVAMIKALESVHGPVKHIVLGSLGLEHKALAGPFASRFPKAQVWLQPGQWSFPLSLPSFFFGFPLGNTRYLPTARQDAAAAAAQAAAAQAGKDGSAAKTKKRPSRSTKTVDNSPPWRDEIDFEVLGPLKFKAVGSFGEAAFLHKDSKTLLVTDCVVRIDAEPPLIVSEDPRALLFHARDHLSEEFKDSKEARAKGWRRIVQFGFVFFPSSIAVTPLAEALQGSLGLGGKPSVSPSMRGLGDGAVPLELYPWSWVGDDGPSFRALQRSGGNKAGLVVAPILRQLIMNREPEAVLDWVERIAGTGDGPATSGRGPGKLRNFKRIIPCHMANDVRANPADFRTAFSFLKQPQGRQPAQGQQQQQRGKYPLSHLVGEGAARLRGLLGTSEKVPTAKPEDLRLLDSASAILSKLGVVAPAKA
eukprot:CAMPEP_0171872792 /NCGR_PEP_ID=MMETSP0992-20121227/34009_1 /TAXON_ID=483369 /ORGANISM="non described non described, Strain CCMP2098" /LENGTH=530 /DNA_ID=CAMNT_0012497313 /DNA_START=74 /DNA_END=1666 /DNA_ORIENTATION=-